MAAVNPFEHVLDTPHWHIFENFGVGFVLPWGLTKYMVLELLATSGQSSISPELTNTRIRSQLLRTNSMVALEKT